MNDQNRLESAICSPQQFISTVATLPLIFINHDRGSFYVDEEVNNVFLKTL